MTRLTRGRGQSATESSYMRVENTRRAIGAAIRIVRIEEFREVAVAVAVESVAVV